MCRRGRYGITHGGDLIPKPLYGRLPLLGTGNSGQPLDWLSDHTDGWITYPRPLSHQERVVAEWHGLMTAPDAPVKPVAQSLYIDLAERPDAPVSYTLLRAPDTVPHLVCRPLR